MAELLAELQTLDTCDAATAWAQRVLGAKNSLTAADARRVEDAFGSGIDYAMLQRSLDELAEHARERREERVVALLATLVPEYANARASAPRAAGA